MPYSDVNREKWTARGLRRDAGSAPAAPPPPVGFRRAFHLTSADHAVSNIIFGRLKVARFSQLNDLFELLAPSFRDKTVKRLVREHKHLLDAEEGLLSFSEDWTAPPLWAHYGARLRGIALGFDLDETIVIDVDYKEKRVDLGPIVKIDSQIASALISTKAKSWEYERECRIRVPLASATLEGEHYFKKFDATIRLAEVVLGPLCSLDVVEVRKKALQLYPGVIVYKARPAEKFFHMVPDEKTVP